MTSPEEFKNKIETFLQSFTSKINDDKVIQEIQLDYNDMMDMCKCLNNYLNIN